MSNLGDSSFLEFELDDIIVYKRFIFIITYKQFTTYLTVNRLLNQIPLLNYYTPFKGGGLLCRAYII